MKAAALELLAALLVAALLFAIGWGMNYRLGHAEKRATAAEARVSLLTLELAQAQLNTRTVTEYVDRVAVVKERGATITKEVPVYVTAKADAACPIPVGFVRLHNAAAQNLPADTTAGAPDAPAEGIALSTVAATVADNYTTCHQTAAQLSALQGWVRGLQAIGTP